LDVDFLFLDPNQNQFFSVKSLLNGLLDGLSYNSSDLANIVCDQVSDDSFLSNSWMNLYISSMRKINMENII